MKNKRLIIGIFLGLVFTLLMLYSSLEYNNYDPNIEFIFKNLETFDNSKILFTVVIEEADETNHRVTPKLQNHHI